ncbi:potassium channel family protein [Geobacter sp. SVR]|uniref:potassium channel family protein n=1 Tax=Geobacter sp. SVR TaxID=2495594 RepID=UPI00143EFD74|nr:potassium channel family protein [Geobacter sp. SVR]BCS55636.1 hypothetical protein GSVR_39440 [Geobacter sp. SVR]GCF83640.1 hypothetical protein GSbR_02400 [Geobacter sp. SVR]
MAIIATLSGIALIMVVLWEVFETIILPRRITRRFRLTRLFYRSTWIPWVVMVGRCIPARRQETWLSVFGPLSLLLLLSIWAAALITGFALLHWGAGSAVPIHGSGSTGLLTDFYLSGTTFFTLGLGDVVPGSTTARLLVVIESGMGFAFLALVISYLPALNQSFSSREISVSLLDARAGSPPTASEMLRRHSYAQGMDALRQLLHEWEQWSAEFLEGHLSYPVLAYFRSQHDNQSWLAALTAILDTCALLMAGVQGACERQAQLTFAIARHALVDLSLVFKTKPREPKENRLSPERLVVLRDILSTAGIRLEGEEASDLKLTELRWLYEPYVEALAGYFRIPVPPWIGEEGKVDNWRASTWTMGAPGAVSSEANKGMHF